MSVLDPIESRKENRASIQKNFDDLKSQLSKVDFEINKCRNFDPEQAIADISNLHSHKSSLLERKSSAFLSYKKHKSDLTLYKSKAVSPLNIFNYLSTEQTTIRAHIPKLVEHCNKMHSIVQDCDKKIADFDREINEKTILLEWHSNFRVDDCEKEKSSIIGKLNRLNSQISTLNSEIYQIESRCGPQISEYNKCVSSISALEDRISRSDAMDRDLALAENGYERALIHQECERLYGEGSPKKVRSDASSQLRRAKADLAKIEKRLRESLRKFNLNITKIIIDGNNACYRDSYHGREFIRLTALTHIVDCLSKKYSITIVFDGTIRDLMRSDDAKIKSIIGHNALIYVAPEKTSADEYIIKMASDNSDYYILSNDRYADYRDYEPIKNGRVIRFMISEKCVMINDLGVDIDLPRIS